MDAEMKAGKSRGPLHHTRCNKDNIDTADKMQTTAGSGLGRKFCFKDAFVVET
jgi:Asp-tRNA(Asn)/Glu-tRNA(Gln) amidotransferase A subunit family amidase